MNKHTEELAIVFMSELKDFATDIVLYRRSLDVTIDDYADHILSKLKELNYQKVIEKNYKELDKDACRFKQGKPDYKIHPKYCEPIEL